MSLAQHVSQVGGIFALFTIWHFVADWLFQSHEEAMAKALDKKVRAWHCFKYTLAFVPVLFIANSFVPWLIACLVLFGSHYVIDSYVPVMLWAKFLREAPQFQDPANHSDYLAFKAFAATPLGLVLMITMDQVFHILFLVPVAWLMLV